MLVSGCLPYKDKCILNNVDYVQKKAVDDKIIEIGTICIKSKFTEANQLFIYVLGGKEKEDKPYYGRFTVESVTLSNIC